jgi:hypothetical protein
MAFCMRWNWQRCHGTPYEDGLPSGLEYLLSLDLHRVIHERGEGRGHGGWAVLDEQGGEVVDRRTFILVGHRRFILGGVSTSKKTSMTHLFKSSRR